MRRISWPVSIPPGLALMFLGALLVVVLKVAFAKEAARPYPPPLNHVSPSSQAALIPQVPAFATTTPPAPPQTVVGDNFDAHYCTSNLHPACPVGSYAGPRPTQPQHYGSAPQDSSAPQAVAQEPIREPDAPPSPEVSQRTSHMLQEVAPVAPPEPGPPPLEDAQISEPSEPAVAPVP
jgi:hypothetical protein